MKTNELEKLLGTTKDTLRYYEKEELISPSRDDNGYRNYSLPEWCCGYFWRSVKQLMK